MFEEVSLYRLKVFREVVTTKSFRAAAERLHISQPAVSAHIRSLENETKTTLLERGRVCKVTEAGRFLYEYANDTLQKAGEVTRIIEELRNGNMGHIAMGASGTLARHLLPDIYSDFKRENPLVEMTLRIGTKNQVCQMAVDWEIDFGFVIGKTALPGLSAKTVVREEMVVVTGANHPLAARDLITPEELSAYPFVIALKKSSHYRMIDNILNANKITIQHILMELEDAESIKRVISNGLGVAVLLKSCILDELRQGKLKSIPVTSGPIYVDLQLISRPDKSLSPIQKRFLKFFDTRIKQVLSN